MKVSSIIKGLIFSSLMAVSVSGCSGKAITLEEVDPYRLMSNYRDLRISGTGYSGEQFTGEDIFDEEEEEIYTKWTVKDVKALVVPVDFTDYPSSLFGSEDHSRGLLDKVMFAEEGDPALNWYSLAAYYKSSSFGQCNISGTVAPWWHTNVASSSITKTDTGYASQLAVQIQDYYRSTAHHDGINLADYDANQDGLVDTIIMIYSAPITTTGEVWWAFCSSVSGAYGIYTPDGSKEGVNRYFWASIKFLFEKGSRSYYSNEEIAAGTAIPDAHTMTHEYGHCLSLPDYYDTDYSNTSPIGALDMMDNNIGDHNIFSKTLYGWVAPKRIAGTKGSLKVTLKSSTTTGDAIIIPAPNEWNNTYLDQYLVVEFITPEGVAKKDGDEPYLGYYPRYFTKAGIRILHVDARLGSWGSGYSFKGYTWTTTRGDSNYIDFAADNTPSRSAYSDYKLIEILPATGKTQKQRGGSAADDTCLYLEGSYFGSHGVFNNYKFNGIDGTQNKAFGFKIHVDKINGNESATITISR